MNKSQLVLDKIYSDSGVLYFENNLRTILEEVVKDLYYSHQELMFQLRLHHLDRAIFKFRQAKERNYIRNTKQYFKTCIISAIKETSLDNLEPLDL